MARQRASSQRRDRAQGPPAVLAWEGARLSFARGAQLPGCAGATARGTTGPAGVSRALAGQHTPSCSITALREGPNCDDAPKVGPATPGCMIPAGPAASGATPADPPAPCPVRPPAGCGNQHMRQDEPAQAVEVCMRSLAAALGSEDQPDILQNHPPTCTRQAAGAAGRRPAGTAMQHAAAQHAGTRGIAPLPTRSTPMGSACHAGLLARRHSTRWPLSGWAVEGYGRPLHRRRSPSQARKARYGLPTRAGPPSSRAQAARRPIDRPHRRAAAYFAPVGG